MFPGLSSNSATRSGARKLPLPATTAHPGTIFTCRQWSLPKATAGLGSRQDGRVHVTRRTSRHSCCRSIGRHVVDRLFGQLTVDARLDVAQVVTTTGTDPAVRV